MILQCIGRNRPLLILCIACVIFVLIVAIRALHTSTPDTLPWSQDPAMVLPHHVASLGPVQLTLGVGETKDPGTLPFTLYCEKPGSESVKVTQIISNNGNDTITGTATRVSCTDVRSVVMVGAIPLAQLKTGDSVTLVLTVYPANRSSLADKEESAQIFRMGTDGNLRFGVDSVSPGFQPDIP